MHPLPASVLRGKTINQMADLLNSNQHQGKWKRKYNSDERIIDRDILSGPPRGLHHHSVPAVMMLSGTAAWGGASVEALREPRVNQLPADPLHRDPPASHVHFASKPLKGIPWVLFYVHWPPCLWSHDPMCFHGIEVIILRLCHVRHLIQKFVWSFAGNS